MLPGAAASAVAAAAAAKAVGKRPALSLLRLGRSVGIREQLWLEEALLRHDARNWCILKDGEAPGAKPTIVLGIGGKADKLVHLDRTAQDGIPLLRRFSGGGTVIVDQDSLFVTFIMNTDETTPNEPYPRPIMKWTATVYGPVFQRAATPETESFELRENDYVFGQLKFGGNAQSIVKDRWLHHTSFLWDFCPRNMEYLQMPERRPEYRRDRPHGAFLTKLKDHTRGGDRHALFAELERELRGRFEVTEMEDGEMRQEVIDGRLGGLDMWAAAARTKDVAV